MPGFGNEVGMIEMGTDLGLCHFIGWQLPNPAGFGTGRLHNFREVDTDIGGNPYDFEERVWTIDDTDPSTSFYARNLILRLPDQLPCPTPGATYLIETGDFTVPWEGMKASLPGDYLAGTSKGDFYSAFARVGTCTYLIQMSMSIGFRLDGLFIEPPWTISEAVFIQYQTASPSRGAYVSYQNSFKVAEPNLDTHFVGGLAQAAAASGVSWYFATTGSTYASSVPMGERLYSHSSGGPYARTDLGNTIDNTFPALAKWDGYNDDFGTLQAQFDLFAT